jgi:hypothetical protein
MPQDGQSTNTTISAPTGKRASTSKSASTKEQVAHLKDLQERIFALMGLKMATDKLRDLKYDVVLAQEDGACTIKITLGVKYDLLTGLVDGRDIWEVQTALDEQIKALDGK